MSKPVLIDLTPPQVGTTGSAPPEGGDARRAPGWAGLGLGVVDAGVDLDVGKEGAAPPPWLWSGRVPCLDGLRAAAIAVVLLGHAAMTPGFTGPLFLAGKGALGVDIFFTISGFLITLLLLREWRRTQTVSLRGFYYRRTLRIIPAYAVFLCAVWACSSLGLFTLDGIDWVSALTYTVNFNPDAAWEIGHLWSLSIEEQFYLAWPLTVLLLGPRRAVWVVVAALVLAPVLRLYIYFTAPQHLIMSAMWTPTRIDYIAAGCLLAIASTSATFRRRVAVSPGKLRVVFAAGFLGLGATVVAGQALPLYQAALGSAVKALCICAVLWACVNDPRGPAGRLLEWKPVVWVGVLSYSIYLYQQLFLNPGKPWWVTRWPVNLLATMAAAAASFYLIERPFLSLKDRKPGHEPATSSQAAPP